MKKFGIFDQSLKSRIGFAIASDLSDVPNEPGIYAWYLPLKGDDSGGLMDFLKSLESNLKRMIPATEVSGEGRQLCFRVRRNAPRFQLNSKPILRLEEEMGSRGLQNLASLIRFLSILSEPVYIGMTNGEEGLKGRLTQHLQTPSRFDSDERWNGAFNSRIAKILNDRSVLTQCLVAYLPIPTDEIGESAPRVIEHILITTICPALSRRG